ncbi:MAG TPA: restriction endonuclease [Pseudonocardiaceae bacterium]|jgi:restriction system protein|nr:restriction endonuclease [Pseudonocardiaceae bacterium]
MHAWLVRAGKAGERERWAIDRGCTGAGFGEIRDLSDLTDRAGVLAAVAGDVPDAQRGAVRNFAAQLWALRDRMSVGDLVVMPLKNSPYLAIGRVTGDYQYASDETNAERRHRRSVEWVVTDVPRTLVKQDLLYSLGAFSTICEISPNDAAWRLGQLMAGKPDPGARANAGNSAKRLESTDEASDIGQSEIDVETYARDRITSRIIEQFAGHRLADLVAAILEADGYSCDVSPEGTDQGVDIIAGKGLLGLMSPKIVVQVKSEAGSVGSPVVQQLQGAIATHAADHGLLVAWGGVTKDATRYLSNQRFAMRVWDSRDVLDGLFDNYDRLPADIQRDVPLKRVWTLAEETG